VYRKVGQSYRLAIVSMSSIQDHLLALGVRSLPTVLVMDPVNQVHYVKPLNVSDGNFLFLFFCLVSAQRRRFDQSGEKTAAFSINLLVLFAD
jgi:hypothetical protein